MSHLTQTLTALGLTACVFFKHFKNSWNKLKKHIEAYEDACSCMCHFVHFTRTMKNLSQIGYGSTHSCVLSKEKNWSDVLLR